MIKKEETKKKLKFKKSYLVAGLCLIGVAVVYLLFKSMNGPAEGSTIPIVSKDSQQTTATLDFEGEHMNFSYPGYYAEEDVQPGQKSARTLEQEVFRGARSDSRQLTIIVNNLSTGQLSEDSNYQARRTQPNLYKEEAITVHGQPLVVMTKLEGYEREAYLLKGNMIGTVTLTSNRESDDLDSEFQKVLDSWSWK